MRQERVQKLNRQPINDRGHYVVYWMQAAQRCENNWALEYAIERANELKLPMVVYFGLTADFPRANERHYRFMLQGLYETREQLAKRGISMIIQQCDPAQGVVTLSAQAAMVITDRGYLAIQKRWRRDAAKKLDCPLVQVEGEVIVPVEQASGKEEYAATTLRPKIHRQWSGFMESIPRRRLKSKPIQLDTESFDISNSDTALKPLGVDNSVGGVSRFHGGYQQARKRLDRFIKERLDNYDTARNDPNIAGTSELSPYLHFGQIGVGEVIDAVQAAGGPGRDAFIEELVVRRELAINFVHYNPNYQSWTCLANWTKATLKTHQNDPREYHYTFSQLEKAATHDPYWNAAQKEMVLTGKMHGYMRMYWGKKILEWSRTIQHAYQTAIKLNDKYELDGRDPNGYAGVAWCFGKHDRPWQERPIFGMVRYMNDKGLKRKFDADGYAARIAKLESSAS